MFTLGLDFGTNSVRALVVRCADGAEYGSRVVDYPSGAQGVLLDPNDGHLARQYPGDYLFSLEESVKGALADLRASYVVTYQLPSRAVGFHSLRILPKHNLNLRFHCRNGYYYEASIP